MVSRRVSSFGWDTEVWLVIGPGGSVPHWVSDGTVFWRDGGQKSSPSGACSTSFFVYGMRSTYGIHVGNCWIHGRCL